MCSHNPNCRRSHFLFSTCLLLSSTPRTRRKLKQKVRSLFCMLKTSAHSMRWEHDCNLSKYVCGQRRNWIEMDCKVWQCRQFAIICALHCRIWTQLTLPCSVVAWLCIWRRRFWSKPRRNKMKMFWKIDFWSEGLPKPEKNVKNPPAIPKAERSAHSESTRFSPHTHTKMTDWRNERCRVNDYFRSANSIALKQFLHVKWMGTGRLLCASILIFDLHVFFSFNFFLFVRIFTVSMCLASSSAASGWANEM